MNLFLYLTNFIVPFLILAIIVYGLLMKINVYEHFIKGARNGFLTVLKIMPTLIGLMVAVGILRASGFLEMISFCIGQFTAAIGFPGELVPLTVVKMFSSSAATGLLLDLYKEFGTDSLIGLIASISMSCTETIFYYYECLFHDRKDQKLPLHTDWSADCHLRRTGSQRGPGSIHAAIDCFAGLNMVH